MVNPRARPGLIALPDVRLSGAATVCYVPPIR
jgi:hypothetical protein